MSWIEVTPEGNPVPYENYPGSRAAYVPDKIDDYLTDPYTGVAVDPKEAAMRLLRGAGMQPGSYTQGAGVGKEAIDRLYASDPRFAQFFPDKNVVYQDVLGLMDKQKSIDAGAGDDFDFGNLIGAGLAAGVGALSGGFGLGSLFDSLGSSINVSSGATPGTYVGSAGEMGGGMDWWGTDYLGDFGFPSDAYNAISANDPIGQLIQNLDAGMSPSQALSGVESVLPGTTRSALEQLFYNMGTNASSGASQLLKALQGGGSGATQDEGSWMSLLGRIAPSLLGAYASNQQAGKLSELAQKYQDFGAPYRSELARISADPNAFYNSPGAQKATDAVLNKLSIGGNPAGSANKQALTIDSLYDQYGRERDRLAGFGGLTNYNAAAPNLEAQAIGQNANMWNAIGAGANDIFNPKPSLSDLFKQMKTAGAF